MNLWDFLSWVANCQLIFNDVNIVGVLWAVTLTLFAFHRFNQLETKKSKVHILISFFLAVTSVVWINHVIDLGVVTVVAVFAGRWIEMIPIVGPLTVSSFLYVFWNVIIAILLFTVFFWQNKVFRFFHFTKQSFFLLSTMVLFYASVTAFFNVWNYNLLADPLRTTYFWGMYPGLRILWGLLFVSIIKKPDLSLKYTPSLVKQYYVSGEHYDWVTDPQVLEKIFHRQRERSTIKYINKYSSNSKILDVGCGTGLITRHLRGNVTGLDINQWNLDQAKKYSPNAKFIVSDCENMNAFPSNTIDLVVFTETLEHLPTPKKALQEIKRILKVGGKAVITVPSNSLVWKFRKYLTTTHLHNEPFHRNYSKNNLEKMLQTFKILEITRIVFGLTLLAVVENRES